MTASSNEDKIVSRPGLRKHVRQLDYNIWLWSRERNVSKKNIKEYARKLFAEAGFNHFKASDGWYRRWFGRYKNETAFPSHKTLIATQRLNAHDQSVSLLCSSHFMLTSADNDLRNIEIVENSSISSEVTNDVPVDATVNLLQSTNMDHSPVLVNTSTNTEDCDEIQGLTDVVNTSKNNVTIRKKGERYLPHFKNEVVNFATSYSIKEAAFFYKVNKGTVSDWIRESNNLTISETETSETESFPDIEFIDWLRNERQKEHVLNTDILKAKMQELINRYQDLEIDKSSKWFYTYYKRFENNAFQKLPPIMYPVAFKIELAILCNTFSKRVLSDLFKVDRKRLRDWFTLYNSDSLKDVKRDVNNYLTDQDIDKLIWEWYQAQTIKPSSKQIRSKGTELYSAAGFTGMRCSPGWFYRWCNRYSLPQASTIRNEKDAQLLEWLLGEFDRNNNVSYENLRNKAAELWTSDEKPSISWAIRFSKRYPSLLQKVPDFNTKLPQTLENKIYKFKEDFSILASEKNCSSLNLIAFDEIPLNFTTSTGSNSSKSLIKKSGFENCHASVIIACSSDGALLPTTLILKTSLENATVDDQSIIIVLTQENAMNDETTIYSWFLKMFRNVTNPTIMICDNYGPHISLKEFYKKELKEKQIEIIVIPEGCSSKLQPICFSLSQQFKSEIEDQWCRWNHDNCWNSVTGTSKSPSDFDIYNWVLRAHNNLANTFKDNIKESFIKAGYNTQPSVIDSN